VLIDKRPIEILKRGLKQYICLFVQNLESFLKFSEFRKSKLINPLGHKP